MSDVVLCECFARDGLQHETAFVPTQTKRALIERFAELFPDFRVDAEHPPTWKPRGAKERPTWKFTTPC